MSVLELFEASVQSNHSAIAVVLESGEESTYWQLNNIADNLATAILPFIRTDYTEETQLVCIMMNRHTPLIASMLAILKCGAAYVPVDPGFPPDRQEYIFNHSKCSLLVADEECFEVALRLAIGLPPSLVICAATGKVISATNVVPSSVVSSQSFSKARALAVAREDGGLMYVLYTSGSTGRPKGVMVKVRGVANIVSWFAKELETNASTRVLALTTTCFDISVLEIYLPLISGGTLVLASSSSQKNPFQLLEVMRKHMVTVFQATPTTYEMLLASGWKGDCGIDILVGGEAFRSSLLPLLGTCRSIRNVYGPTETTIWSSSYSLPFDVALIPGGSVGGVVSVPVGKPISHTMFYLVDPNSADHDVCSLNATEGELYIGGIGVAAGYLHAPDMTAAKFIRNPFGEEGIVYRTGDLVSLLDGGEYVFIRRLDDQVKVDGFRIELAEIEAVYASHPLVEQAVAVVRENRLGVFIRARTTVGLSRSDEAALWDHASRSLTHYMLPKHTMVVPSFPQTANGKLDRNALPPFVDNDDDVASVSACLSSSEMRTMVDLICDIIQGIRGRRPKSSAHFTSVGIDSLGAVLFIKSLSDALRGVVIDPQRIYAPDVTIASLAGEIYGNMARNCPAVLQELKICAATDIDMEADAVPQSSVENDWEGGLLRNWQLYEGLRGAFTFMVLWDHFHPLSVFAADSWQADTSLFVILSGFTTAVQLRDPPQQSESKMRITIKQREAFDWQSYLLGRAVGIFPVLWVSLIVNAPRWKGSDDYTVNNLHLYTRAASNQCVVLYIVGLQSWGPNTTLYGSIILNVFLIYGAIRLCMHHIQSTFIKTAATFELPVRQKNFGNKLSDIITMLAFSRPCPSIALLTTVLWFIATPIVFVLLWAFMGWKNGLTYIPFFVAGASAAHISESLHWAMWNRHQTLDSWTEADLLPSSLSYSPDAVVNHNSISVPRQVPERWMLTMSSVIWRFAPDGLAILGGMIMSTDGPGSYTEARLITWVAVPCIVIAYIVIVSLQRDLARLNLSRFFLESPPMNLLGYISFPMYLLQHVAFDYYGAMWSEDIRTNGFASSPLWVRVVSVLILIAVCWLIQKFVQDTLVTRLFARFLQYRMKRNKSGTMTPP